MQVSATNHASAQASDASGCSNARYTNTPVANGVGLKRYSAWVPGFDARALTGRILAFLSLPLPHPNARSTAILVDELDEYI
jgi:hypothetical protein